MSSHDSGTHPNPSSPGSRCCGQHGAFEVLHDCHQHILERLGELEHLARDLGPASHLGEPARARLGDLLSFFDTAIPIHSADEEETLFPRLRAAVEPHSGSSPMDCMEREHTVHRALLSSLRQAAERRDARGVAHASRALVNEYRTHIAKEEDVLYPWARGLLDAPSVETMTQEMRNRRERAGKPSC